MQVTSEKNCTCHTCGKDYHYLGIARHRAMHRERKEDCDITYTHGTATFIGMPSPRTARRITFENRKINGEKF